MEITGKNSVFGPRPLAAMIVYGHNEGDRTIAFCSTERFIRLHDIVTLGAVWEYTADMYVIVVSPLYKFGEVLAFMDRLQEVTRRPLSNMEIMV